MIIGISITKKVTFRAAPQEFSNVYHYYMPGAQTAPYADIVAEIKAIEVPFHSADVTFPRGAVWTADGTPGENQMVYQTALSGTGSQSTNASMDRERALLFRWPAGFSSTGKPVYLRKWFHSCGSFNGKAFVAGELQNTTALSTADRAAMASAVDALRKVGVTESWDLCSPSGRLWEGPAECHQWLEHHQLGDQWRA